MLKIISKLFKTKDKYEESTVEFKLDIPKLTKEELFDTAVLDVIHSRLKKRISKEMAELCYPDEVVRQTKLAMKEGILSREEHHEVTKQYPMAYSSTPRYASHPLFQLPFHMDKFIERLVVKEIT